MSAPTKTTTKDQLSIMSLFLTEGTIELLESIGKDSNQSAAQVARGLIEEALLPFTDDED